MKQCPNCKGNIADFVAACPYCGAAVAVAAAPGQQPLWTGPQQNSGKAIASLVSGLVFFFWPISAIVGVVLGHLALSEIKRSAGRLAGQGMAIAGLVLGYLGIAVLPFVLIIAAIAIPNLLRSRMAANEASAVGTLRTYNTAMLAYTDACPDIGYPTSLQSLGPGSKDCQHLGLVEAQLAAQLPVKNGYHFFYMPQRDSQGIVTKYVLSADPVAPGASGMRHFFTDESGIIRFSMRGSADVHSEPLQ